MCLRNIHEGSNEDAKPRAAYLDDNCSVITRNPPLQSRFIMPKQSERDSEFWDTQAALDTLLQQNQVVTLNHQPRREKIQKLDGWRNVIESATFALQNEARRSHKHNLVESRFLRLPTEILELVDDALVSTADRLALRLSARKLLVELSRLDLIPNRSELCRLRLRTMLGSDKFARVCRLEAQEKLLVVLPVRNYRLEQQGPFEAIKRRSSTLVNIDTSKVTVNSVIKYVRGSARKVTKTIEDTCTVGDKGLVKKFDGTAITRIGTNASLRDTDGAATIKLGLKRFLMLPLLGRHQRQRATSTITPSTVGSECQSSARPSATSSAPGAGESGQARKQESVLTELFACSCCEIAHRAKAFDKTELRNHPETRICFEEFPIRLCDHVSIRHRDIFRMLAQASHHRREKPVEVCCQAHNAFGIGDSIARMLFLPNGTISFQNSYSTIVEQGLWTMNRAHCEIYDFLRFGPVCDHLAAIASHDILTWLLEEEERSTNRSKCSFDRMCTEIDCVSSIRISILRPSQEQRDCILSDTQAEFRFETIWQWPQIASSPESEWIDIIEKTSFVTTSGANSRRLGSIWNTSFGTRYDQHVFS